MSSEHMNRPSPDALRALADAIEARDRASYRYTEMLKNPALYARSVKFDFHLSGPSTRGISGDREPIVAAIEKIISEQVEVLARAALREFLRLEQEARARAGLVPLQITPDSTLDGQEPDTIAGGAE